MIEFEPRFGLEPADWRKILRAALSRGGDFADLYFEYRIFNLVNLEEDIVKETAEAVSLGLGIRVNAGEKTGFAYVNELAMDNILSAARSAAAVASGPGIVASSGDETAGGERSARPKCARSRTPSGSRSRRTRRACSSQA